MRRRDFFPSPAALGLLAASRGALASTQEAPRQTAGSVRPLKAPENEMIRVAFAISKGTTEIDYVGPEAVFETWYQDPVTKKHAPRFKLFTVSDTREPVDGRIADTTFEPAPPPHIVVVPAHRGSPA